MPLKKKILLSSLATLIVLAAMNFRWINYVAHLARHQAGVIFGKVPIAELIQNPKISGAEKNLLEKTLVIRAFIEKEYGLTDSKSYRYFYDLKRNSLGFNITLTDEFDLKPKSFEFWPIGSFEYLGFFDKSLAEAWVSHYKMQHADVYLSEIGGYSTLGWFEDPLYSTQLAWGETGIALLLAHELAHEKLYFKNDTAFSELLASFIERKAARAYLLSGGKPVATPQEIHAFQERNQNFTNAIERLKTDLSTLYKSTEGDAEKRKQKRALFLHFQNWLRTKKEILQTVPAARQMAELKEINNATLVQFHRYSPVTAQFETVFNNCRTTQKPFVCFFDALAALKNYTKIQRREWLKKG